MVCVDIIRFLFFITNMYLCFRLFLFLFALNSLQHCFSSINANKHWLKLNLTYTVYVCMSENVN